MPEDDVLTTEGEQTEVITTEGEQTEVNPLLAPVKMALRVSTTAFDTEIESLIEAAKLDLGVAGVVLPGTLDAIVHLAVITYCRLHFGQPDDYDRLKRSYDEQKAQLATCTGYTDWLNGE
jgi:hypothetical protein